MRCEKRNFFFKMYSKYNSSFQWIFQEVCSVQFTFFWPTKHFECVNSWKWVRFRYINTAFYPNRFHFQDKFVYLYEEGSPSTPRAHQKTWMRYLKVEFWRKSNEIIHFMYLKAFAFNRDSPSLWMDIT